MDNDKVNQSREEGRKTWESVSGQLAEAGGFFSSMCRSVIISIKRMIWGLLIMGILGALLGGALWWLKPGYYSAEMTVSYVHYEKKIYADMLGKLDMLLQSGEDEKLSVMLGLDEDKVSSMRFIRSFNIRKEPLAEDLSTEKLPFYIQVGVGDAAILPELQEAIINYLNNTEFIQSRLMFMEKKAKEELHFLEHRLAIADSLSKLYIINQDGVNDEKAITRMELLEESLAIYARMQEVKGLLKFNLNLEVLDGFVAIERKAGKSLMSYLLLGLLGGLSLRILIRVFS